MGAALRLREGSTDDSNGAIEHEIAVFPPRSDKPPDYWGSFWTGRHESRYNNAVRVIGRLLPNALSVALFVAVAGLLFLIARPHYLPSPGQFWNILGGEGSVLDATAPQDLAARAGTSVFVLVLAAALHSAFLALLAIGSALVLGVPFGFYLAIHAPRRIGEVLRSVTKAACSIEASPSNCYNGLYVGGGPGHWSSNKP